LRKAHDRFRPQATATPLLNADFHRHRRGELNLIAMLREGPSVAV
jgi:hypothetical protein